MSNQGLIETDSSLSLLHNVMLNVPLQPELRWDTSVFKKQMTALPISGGWYLGYKSQPFLGTALFTLT